MTFDPAYPPDNAVVATVAKDIEQAHTEMGGDLICECCFTHDREKRYDKASDNHPVVE